MTSKADILRELQEKFSDLINYESDDPTQPVDPLTYVTPEGDTCLHIASIRGDKRSVQFLLELGLDVNARGDMGNTPLHYAKQFAHPEIVSLLLQSGAASDSINEFGRRAGE